MFLLCALLTAGCAGPSPADRPATGGEHTAERAGVGGHPSPADVRDELLEADRAFARATAERRLAGWVGGFSPNGRMILPTGSVEGREAILDLMAPLFRDSTYVLSWEPEIAGASEAGDLGYTVGRYESRRTGPAGEVIHRSGMYVSVWRRQADGTWAVEADIGNLEQSP